MTAQRLREDRALQREEGMADVVSVNARHTRWAKWSVAGGAAMALGGLAVVLLAWAGRIPTQWSALALIGGAAIELSSGVALRRHGGAWMAQLFDAAQVLGYGAFLFTTWHFEPRATTAAPIALMLGLVCLTNALFRALALLIDRPWTIVSDVVDLTVTFILAVVIFRTWRSATPGFVGLVAGVDLAVGGLCVFATGRAAWLHPEHAGYHGRMERLTHAQAGRLDPRELW